MATTIEARQKMESTSHYHDIDTVPIPASTIAVLLLPFSAIPVICIWICVIYRLYFRTPPAEQRRDEISMNRLRYASIFSSQATTATLAE